MKHFEIAENDHATIARGAKRHPPEFWAKRGTAYHARGLTLAGSYCTILAIVARAHWTMINGQWHPNGL